MDPHEAADFVPRATVIENIEVADRVTELSPPEKRKYTIVAASLTLSKATTKRLSFNLRKQPDLTENHYKTSFCR